MGENKRYPSRPDWHPILAAQEYEPGQWVMLDTLERPYAMIDFIRRGEELGYRVTTWEQVSADREIIGYYRTLRAAASAGHRRYIATRGPHNRHPLEGHVGTITNPRR